MERAAYRPDEAFFEQHLKVVFRNASVTIYEVTQPALTNPPSGQAANP
jgi:uncharacterized membrane protein